MIGNHDTTLCTVSLALCMFNTAVCDPPCANNGTCIQPGECNCTEGWTGEACMTGNHDTMSCIVISLSLCMFNAAVCDPPCANNGTCIQPGECNCTEGWIGEQCMTGNHDTMPCIVVSLSLCMFNVAVCDLPCANNGTCIQPAWDCNCTEEWTGEQCMTGNHDTHWASLTLWLNCAAICTPECENGGNCTAPGICECTKQWEGGQCTQGREL